MYSLGYSGKQIEKMALATDWYEVQNDEPKRKYLPFFRKKDTGKYQLNLGLNGLKPVVPTGLIYGQKIILDLSKWTREFEQVYDFDLLPIPFRCIAFDIISGKEIVIKEGSLSHALRASLSLPTIFAPVEWDEKLQKDSFKSYLGLGLALLLARSNPDLARGALTASQALGVQTVLDFTRQNEKEADRVGIGILHKAGFDVRGSIDFFKTLQKGNQYSMGGAPSFLRTHPITSERISDIENRLAEYPYKQRVDNPSFHFVKAKIKVINDSTFLSINNFHLDTVYIIGYGKKIDKIIDFKSPIEMGPFQKKW